MADAQPASRRRLHLTYAETSRDLVAPLARALDAAGFDTRPMPDEADAVIVCWTPAAVASDAVNLQAARARKARKLVAVLLAPCTPPASVGGRFDLSDLSGWRGDPSDREFVELVHAIHARLSGRVLSGEFWRSRYFTWGSAGAIGLAAIALVANFGGVKQAYDSVFNPAASERALIATDAKVEEVLTLLKEKSGKPLDAGSETVMRESIARLLSAQDGARASAGQKLANGDVEGALGELRSAADEGEKAVARLVETWKDIGALAFPDRTLEAVKAYERVTEIAPRDLEARLQLGQLYMRLGHFAEAEQVYRFVEGNFPQGEEWMRAAAVGALGFIALKQERDDEAERYFREALALNEELGETEGQAGDHADLAMLQQSRGDLKGAEQSLLRSLDLYLKADNLEGQSLAHLRLGNIALDQPDPDAAERSFRQALAISTRLGDIEGQASAIGSLGDVAAERGQLDAARKNYLEALGLAKEISAQEIEALLDVSLGRLAEKQNDKADAIRRYQEARGLYRVMGLEADVKDMERRMKALGASPSPEGPEN